VAARPRTLRCIDAEARRRRTAQSATIRSSAYRSV
jgi:hypothetical protein